MMQYAEHFNRKQLIQTSQDTKLEQPQMEEFCTKNWFHTDLVPWLGYKIKISQFGDTWLVQSV